ncbi:GTP-binding protein [Jeotgalibacillus sp. S-D1]|uniref:CobW family GTP-binding protein n=1 Tax=Jeotgalibacillus sp. S-D1 TaxID=2552189 RepID=UPI0010597FBA|nr:GTP-binding protein [Jeotgalibacillus sp. S-D1]TDL34813.1 GTP-binding protein [Jeotgalibacillus sp. S-D1]
MQNQKKEVYILSGFLGSGKTSLLKQMIKIQKINDKVPAVLMNEIGKVSIDSASVDEDLPLKELLDGCICCSIQDKLESQLQDLLWNETFDSLLIETTGAAHPVEVVDAIMSPMFADSLEFKGIITVVDAVQWINRRELPPQILQLLREQIKHAGILLLNKIDLINEMQQGNAIGELQSINAHANIVMTNWAKINPDILNSIHFVSKEETQKMRIDQELNIQALVYTFEQEVNQLEFENWMRTLPETVYRMKGYIPFSHEKYPMLFQYSFGMPIYLSEDIRMPKNLVIIGEGLSKQTIFSELNKLEKNKESEEK